MSLLFVFDVHTYLNFKWDFDFKKLIGMMVHISFIIQPNQFFLKLKFQWQWFIEACLGRTTVGFISCKSFWHFQFSIYQAHFQVKKICIKFQKFLFSTLYLQANFEYVFHQYAYNFISIKSESNCWIELNLVELKFNSICLNRI